MQKWGECHNDRGPDKGHETHNHVNTNSDLNLAIKPYYILFSEIKYLYWGKNKSSKK